jgi:hypothetical protein
MVHLSASAPRTTRDRASRLADTAALFYSMGDPAVESQAATLRGAGSLRQQELNSGSVAAR